MVQTLLHPIRTTKGVYLPSKREIILGTYSDTRNSTTGENDSKNSKDDVDVELYSLRKFFKMLRNGDTAALELLHTPEELIVEKHPIWDELVAQKDKFVSKKINAMIGYARQQAAKYGIKGSRMGELNTVIQVLRKYEKTFDFNNPKLKLVWDDLVNEFKGMKHVHLIELEMKTINQTRKFPAFEILGKKFDHHNTFPHVLQILTRIYKEYGYRARQAKKNNGIDWKALSHALRVMYQGQELLSTGKITLPHSGDNLQLLRDVKQGLKPFDEVSLILEEEMEKLEKLNIESTLQEKVDEKFTEDLTYEYFEKVVLSEI